MSDQPPSIPEPAASSAPPPPAGAPPPAKKSRRTLFLIIGGVASTLCVCVAVVAAFVAQGIFAVSREQAAITPVIQQFMAAMERRDTDAAYDLFSSRAQRQTPLAEVEQLVGGENYVLFEGYEDAKVETTNLTSSINTNQDVPQGQVATVSGSITYADSVQGTFRAVLEREDDAWRLFSINVTVPPSKFTATP